MAVVTIKVHHPHDGCSAGTKGHTRGNPAMPEGIPATPGAAGLGGVAASHPAVNPISNPRGFAAAHGDTPLARAAMSRAGVGARSTVPAGSLGGTTSPVGQRPSTTTPRRPRVSSGY